MPAVFVVRMEFIGLFDSVLVEKNLSGVDKVYAMFAQVDLVFLVVPLEDHIVNRRFHEL